jgi:membrane protease subunit HflC
MGKLTIPLIIVILAVVIVVPQTLFVVDETQMAIVTRFGEFKRAHTSPGLQVKTPFAEQVIKFDRRLLRVDVTTASMLTEDKRNLVIDSYARYKIINPLTFFKSLRSELSADARVSDIVNTQLRQEVARDLQNEVISETREDIMHRVTEASNWSEISRSGLYSQYLDVKDNLSLSHPLVRVLVDETPDDDEPGRLAFANELALLQTNPSPAELEGFGIAYLINVEESLGIRIIDVRIKRADFPPDIETSVFSRMEAERERIASGLRAEGTQRDSEIRADVDRRINIILETAEGTSALLRGEAEQEAIDILATALEKNPEFYAFRRSLEAYKVFLDSQTTVILDPDSDLLKYLSDPSGGSP